MPEFSFSEKKIDPKAERREIEKRIADRVRRVLIMLELSLSELSEAPAVSNLRESAVNQAMIIEAMLKLCASVRPNIQVPRFGNADGRISVRTPLENVCVGCGGPARIKIRGEWMCEGCSE